MNKYFLNIDFYNLTVSVSLHFAFFDIITQEDFPYHTKNHLEYLISQGRMRYYRIELNSKKSDFLLRYQTRTSYEGRAIIGVSLTQEVEVGHIQMWATSGYGLDMGDVSRYLLSLMNSLLPKGRHIDRDFMLINMINYDHKLLVTSKMKDSVP